jgi:hypothetical protein
VNALYSNSTGADNTASGVSALEYNTTGTDNTASGFQSLQNSTTGSYNIAIGNGAGSNLITGSDNIDVGNSGGDATEASTIRIGDAIQTTTYIAGISGVTLPAGTGSQVLIDSFGQLGTIESSARYKRDIHDMGDASDKLMKLRPVAFRYKADPTGTRGGSSENLPGAGG